LVLLLATLAAVAFVPARAYALPGDPDPPAPEKPGDGLLGWLDSQSGPSLDDSVYGKYGYAGLRWHTYDLGVGGDLRDPWAIVDTGFGNWMFTCAKFFVGLANSLHQANRADSLSGLDPVLTKGTTAVHDALYQPFLPIALIMLAILLLWRTHRSDLPASVRAVGWALLVMTLAIGLFQYPVRAVNGVDQMESGTISQIDTGFSQATGGTGDPTLSQSEMLVETVLYRQWLRGEFGNPDSAVAKQYGRDLYDAQAYSRTERQRLDAQPSTATFFEKAKNAKFNDTANKIQAADPTAYDYLTGHGHSRLGAGFVAVAVALPTAGFRAVADLLVFAARIIIRLLVIFFPGLAVVGVLLVGPVRTALVAGAAAVVNSVVFSVGAGINVLAANILLGPDVHLPTWLAVVFLGVISLIMWKAFKPFRHLTVMVNPSHNFAAGALGMAGGGGMLRRFASAAAGSYLGTRAGVQDEEDSRRDGADRLRPETYSAPEPADAEARRVRVSSVRADAMVADQVTGGQAALDSPARPALPPPGLDAAALLSGPGGRAGGRAEDVTVYLEPATSLAGAAPGGRGPGDWRVPVHAETITGEEVRPHVEDAALREVFQPGRRPDLAARAESLRAADAELVDGREVYMIYRPGGGLEARDAR
jgi:hypothetical protein